MGTCINYSSELSLEELEEMRNKGEKTISIKSKDVFVYDIDTFIDIKKIILDIVKECPQPPFGDPDREKKIFSYIYVKLAQMIKYDEFASKAIHAGPYARDIADKRLTEAAGLYGLISGTALCSGYSMILMNILSECGIKATYISGQRHAWNQVYLDGVWYNCDLTNDADFVLAGLNMEYFLKSNDSFGEGEYNNYKRYPTHFSPAGEIKICQESVSDQQQEILINEAKDSIRENNDKKEKEGRGNTFLATVGWWIKQNVGNIIGIVPSNKFNRR